MGEVFKKGGMRNGRWCGCAIPHADGATFRGTNR